MYKLSLKFPSCLDKISRDCAGPVCLFSVFVLFLFFFFFFFIYQQNGSWMTFTFILPTPFVISRKCKCFVTKLKDSQIKGLLLWANFSLLHYFLSETVLELKCCWLFSSPDYTPAVFPPSLPNSQGLLARRIPLKVQSWPTGPWGWVMNMNKYCC